MTIAGGIVAVLGSSSTPPASAAWAEAERCGRQLAGAGFDVVTGGYGGTMEAVSRGAADAGGHVIGVTAPSVFPGRSGGNPHLDDEIAAESLTERIHLMMTMSDAVIALPGSIGTVTELFVAWNLAFVARFDGSTPRPVVAVGTTWQELVRIVTKRLDTGSGLVTCTTDVDEAVRIVTAALG